ncbi:helix-turn-helix transcriptional regulator [Streptomyces iakyrus]|uniref:helix-turn-helix transcriptional regulator n=1 Tax=Streptomyces iakyrus TaxID=68219 RepID=UPI0038272DE4
MADQLLSPKQVHDEYGIALQTLANYRWQGIGPAYVKTNPSRAGRVKYRRSAIEAWLDAQTVRPGGVAA